MKTLKVAKLLQYPYVWKITMIPLGVNDRYALGLILPEKHVNLNLYVVCHEWIFVAWGHGLYFGGSVLVAMPQIIWSDGSATYFCSGGSATIICIWWLCHIICSGSHAANSVVCSGWVGQVVSLHGVRLVRGCIRLDMVGFLHKHVISVLFCYGPMGLILYPVLG